MDYVVVNVIITIFHSSHIASHAIDHTPGSSRTCTEMQDVLVTPWFGGHIRIHFLTEILKMAREISENFKILRGKLIRN